MSKKKYIILTGANGYLGSYICRELVGQGYGVIAFRFKHWASTIIEHEDIGYYNVDISKKIEPQQDFDTLLKDKSIAGIINAAALLGSSDFEKNHLVNAFGVTNMVEFAKERNISRFIQISSVVVLKNIKGPYGITKLEGQKILERSGLDHTTFIPAMILGPESLGINRILKNVYRFPLVVPLIGFGRQTQHPIYVRDFAKYIVKSIESPVCHGKTYQIAGDTIIPFRNLIRMILRIKGDKKMFVPIPPAAARGMGKFFQAIQKVPVFTAEHVKGIMQDSRLDTLPLEQDLGFSPTPLEEALRQTLDEIGSDWNKYLQPRKERVVKIDK